PPARPPASALPASRLATCVRATYSKSISRVSAYCAIPWHRPPDRGLFMHQSAIWLSEQDVASLVSLNDIIGELEVGMRSLGEGKGFNIPKALGSIDAA